MPTSFRGTLHYLDEPGRMIVSQLVISNDDLVLNGQSQTTEHGAWDLNVTLEKNGALFYGTNLTAFQSDEESDPFNLFFTRIDFNSDQSVCDIEGIWEERGSRYRFAGTLISS
jgi:hypothetical protein